MILPHGRLCRLHCSLLINPRQTNLFVRQTSCLRFPPISAQYLVCFYRWRWNNHDQGAGHCHALSWPEPYPGGTPGHDQRGELQAQPSMCRASPETYGMPEVELTRQVDADGNNSIDFGKPLYASQGDLLRLYQPSS